MEFVRILSMIGPYKNDKKHVTIPTIPPNSVLYSSEFWNSLEFCSSRFSFLGFLTIYPIKKHPIPEYISHLCD